MITTNTYVEIKNIFIKFLHDQNTLCFRSEFQKLLQEDVEFVVNSGPNHFWALFFSIGAVELQSWAMLAHV